jgi:hypothetical protein
MQERGRFTEPLLLAIAVIVPLAGAVLAIMQFTEGDRSLALRIGAATLLGVCLYALLFV